MSKLVHTLFIVAVLIVGSLTDVATAGESGQKRPNVLFIIVDDQSPFDLKLYNAASKLDTPNIDN